MENVLAEYEDEFTCPMCAFLYPVRLAGGWLTAREQML